MVKTKQKSKKMAKRQTELEGVYILKIVLYVIVGSQWIWLTNPQLTKQIPFPLGLFIGIWFALHDHFQIDRKIEYALLLIASLFGFWGQIGMFINVLH